MIQNDFEFSSVRAYINKSIICIIRAGNAISILYIDFIYDMYDKRASKYISCRNNGFCLLKTVAEMEAVYVYIH